MERGEVFEPDRWLDDGDKVTVGELELDVIHCPGHTPGHVVFYHAPSRFAIVGDGLFQGSSGRADFPLGNHPALHAAIAGKRLAHSGRLANGKDVGKTLAQESPGSLSPVEYKQFVGDLVGFLEYMAEPARNERINIGIGVLIFLGVLFAFAYALKRNYWKDIH